LRGKKKQKGEKEGPNKVKKPKKRRKRGDMLQSRGNLKKKEEKKGKRPPAVKKGRTREHQGGGKLQKLIPLELSASKGGGRNRGKKKEKC